jgi:hypothetical protein
MSAPGCRHLRGDGATVLRKTAMTSIFQRLRASFVKSAGTIVFGMEDGTVSIFGLIFGVAANHDQHPHGGDRWRFRCGRGGGVDDGRRLSRCRDHQ